MMEKTTFMQMADMSLNEANIWHPLFINAMRLNKIHKRQDRLFFLSACLSESKSFRRLVDNMDYSVSELKDKFIPMMSAYQCEMLGRTVHQKAKGRAIANLAYRGVNGNKLQDDGWRFRPRGLLSATGMDTYRNLSAAFNIDFLAAPERLEEPALATMSAAYLWRMRQAGKLDSLGQISYLFNGNGRDYNKYYSHILTIEGK